MSVPRTKRSLLNTVIAVAVGEDAVIRVGDGGLQRAQLRLGVRQHFGVLHGDQPIVHRPWGSVRFVTA